MYRFLIRHVSSATRGQWGYSGGNEIINDYQLAPQHTSQIIIKHKQLLSCQQGGYQSGPSLSLVCDLDIILERIEADGEVTW